MKKSLKTMAVLTAAAAMAILPPVTAKAESWQSDAVGWWVANDDGSYLVNQWYQDPASGLYYYMGADGYMLTNTATPDGYYVDANGVWIQGAAAGGGQQSGGQVQSSGGYQRIYGALAANDHLVFTDAEDNLYEFVKANRSVLRTYTVEQRIAAWARHSDLGAAWKEVMDRYNSYGIITGDLPFPEYSDDTEGMMIEMSCYLAGILESL